MLSFIVDSEYADIHNLVRYFKNLAAEKGYEISIAIKEDIIIVKHNEEFGFDAYSTTEYLQKIISRLLKNDLIQEDPKAKDFKYQDRINSGFIIKIFNKNYFNTQVQIQREIIKQKKLLAQENAAIPHWHNIPSNIRIIWNRFSTQLQEHIIQCIANIYDNSRFKTRYLKMLEQKKAPKIPVLINDKLYDLIELMLSAEQYLKIEEQSSIFSIKDISFEDIEPATEIFTHLQLAENQISAAHQILMFLEKEFINTNSSGIKKIISKLNKIIDTTEEETILEKISETLHLISNERLNGLCGFTRFWSQSRFFGAGRNQKATAFYEFFADENNLFTNHIKFSDTMQELKAALSSQEHPENSSKIK